MSVGKIPNFNLETLKKSLKEADLKVEEKELESIFTKYDICDKNQKKIVDSDKGDSYLTGQEFHNFLNWLWNKFREDPVNSEKYNKYEAKMIDEYPDTFGYLKND